MKIHKWFWNLMIDPSATDLPPKPKKKKPKGKK